MTLNQNKDLVQNINVIELTIEQRRYTLPDFRLLVSGGLSEWLTLKNIWHVVTCSVKAITGQRSPVLPWKL